MKLMEITNNVRYIEQLDDSVPKIVELLRKHCSDSLKTGAFLYKGMDFHGHAFVGDPKKVGRKSKNTSNFYTIFLSHTLKDQGFPLRSESFICTNKANKGYAEGFGYLYAVFPYNGSSVACIDKFDIWEVRGRFFTDTGTLEYLNNSFSDAELDDTDWESFKKSLKDICEKNDGKLRFGRQLDFESYTYDQIINEIEKQYQPEKLSIIKSTPSSPKYDDNVKRECWTDGKCIFVSFEILESVFERIAED